MSVEDTPNRCPDCGSNVDSYLSCHTWPKYSQESGLTTWMSCMPCDSATEWFCVGDAECFCSLDTGVIEPYCYACGGTGIDEGWGCGWRYTEGLNPDNPRSVENETHRPEWL